MANELVKRESTAVITKEQWQEQINKIQDVLRNVMIRDVHFGVVKGCGDKQVLLKPGAEKILATFHIGVRYKVEDLGDINERRYRIIATGFSILNGADLGDGLGECSSNEKKFAWREAICDEEYNDTPETKRQILYKKEYGSGNILKIKQIKTHPADIANTVLKMGKKRAMIDLCLSVTACSDIFTQDIIEEGGVGEIDDVEVIKDGQVSSRAPDGKPNRAFKPISDAQDKRLWAILSSPTAKHSKDELMKYLEGKYGIDTTKEIERETYNNVIDWIEGK